jgi:nitroimidazol reductase NimA-like FMN-containing flavoprotein (pyridoxamine 5'-phosphate oxidase superfamily)
MTMPDEIARMIRERDLCVLATSRGDMPHASLMAYATEPDVRYIYMATPANSRKWANLSANPNMALLIDEREQALGEGRAHARALTVGCVSAPVSDAEELTRIIDLLRKRHPHLDGFLAGQGMEVIRCRPLWCLLLTGAEHSLFVDLENSKIA